MSARVAFETALRRARHCSVPCSLRHRVFLEIFSGAGHLAAAVMRCESSTLCWDINRGPDYDLTSRKNQQLLRGWVSAGLVWGFHLDPPCASFSIARSGRPGPLRSAAHPAGLPNLSATDQTKVEIGNVLANFSCSLLLVGRRMGVPCALENPQTSRLWLLPCFRALNELPDQSAALTHFCMHGVPWKKATTFIGFNINLLPVGAFQRRSSRRGVCARTQRPHLHLRGTSANE